MCIVYRHKKVWKMDTNCGILAVLGVFLFIETTTGLRCNQCRQTSALPGTALYDSVINDVDSGMCPNWFYTQPRDHDVYCNKTNQDACVKMVLYDNHTIQNYFIYRDCYNSVNETCSDGADTTITHEQFGTLTGRIYCCSGDNCNTANGLRVDKVLFGLLLAMGVSLMVTKR